MIDQSQNPRCRGFCTVQGHRGPAFLFVQQAGQVGSQVPGQQFVLGYEFGCRTLVQRLRQIRILSKLATLGI